MLNFKSTFSVSEAAKILRCSSSKLRTYAANHKIPGAYKVSKAGWLIPAEYVYVKMRNTTLISA